MTPCAQCGKSPAKFTLESQNLCAEDFAQASDWENTLAAAKGIVASFVPPDLTYTLRDRSNIDRKGRYMLMGPRTLLMADSLDELIVCAEQWIIRAVPDPVREE